MSAEEVQKYRVVFWLKEPIFPEPIGGCWYTEYFYSLGYASASMDHLLVDEVAFKAQVEALQDDGRWLTVNGPHESPALKAARKEWKKGERKCRTIG